MRCIFCREERVPSIEHVIPENVGGTITIQTVCKACNDILNKRVDGPFGTHAAIILIRAILGIGGKRGQIPNPFSGTGTTERGDRVVLDRDFAPYLLRQLVIEQTQVAVRGQLSVDVRDRGNLDTMLGRPLRKALVEAFPDWTRTQVDARVTEIVAQAKATPSAQDQGFIAYRLTLDWDVIRREFLKIAYETWASRFGEAWVETSETARVLRATILGQAGEAPAHTRLFVPLLPLQCSDPLQNHVIVEAGGRCLIRLFTITGEVECESARPEFQLSDSAGMVTFQDFLAGRVLTGQVIDHLVKE